MTYTKTKSTQFTLFFYATYIPKKVHVTYIPKKSARDLRQTTNMNAANLSLF